MLKLERRNNVHPFLDEPRELFYFITNTEMMSHKQSNMNHYSGTQILPRYITHIWNWYDQISLRSQRTTNGVICSRLYTRRGRVQDIDTQISSHTASPPETGWYDRNFSIHEK